MLPNAAELKQMIMSFRILELQSLLSKFPLLPDRNERIYSISAIDAKWNVFISLLFVNFYTRKGFAGKEKLGRKSELLQRSLSILKNAPPQIHQKIQELYKNQVQEQAAQRRYPNNWPRNDISNLNGPFSLS